MARMRSLRSKSSTVKTLARCADGSIPRAVSCAAARGSMRLPSSSLLMPLEVTVTGTPASWACWRMRYSPTGERQMLPVQTVMIRYMVLVYRWGGGWLSAVGAWGGSLDGTVTGGCARRLGLPLPEPGAKRPRRRRAGGA